MVSTVAVGHDGTATAAKAVDMAVELARAFDAELILLSAFHGSAVPYPVDSHSVELDWALNSADRTADFIEDTARDLREQGVACRTRISEGDPAEVLVRLAGECAADILVVGNKGMHRRVLGSVPNSVTHKAGCHVMVVKTT
jgi:nucleotide-binding universal stress UspA family protein